VSGLRKARGSLLSVIKEKGTHQVVVLKRKMKSGAATVSVYWWSWRWGDESWAGSCQLPVGKMELI